MIDLNNFIPVSILGVGKAVPDNVVVNDDLSKIVETNDEWITSRTGIKERRLVSGDETNVSLASKAAKDALGYAGVNAEDVDLLIVATSTPDYLYPSVACQVQSEIGANSAHSFDLTAACTGLIFALNVARNMIMTGSIKTALVIGSDVNSRFLDWSDRSTCVLFGDGASALLLQASSDGVNDVLSVDVHSDGAKALELNIPLSGNNCPLVEQNTQKKSTVYMNGREIYKFAVTAAPDTLVKAIDKAGLNNEDIDYLVPHQANVRIIDAIASRINIDKSKVLVNLDKYGNTSAASIGIALKEALEEDKIEFPAKLAITGFGAGLTWGAAVIQLRHQDKRLG